MNVVVIGMLLLVGVVALFMMQGVRQLAPWEQAVIQRGPRGAAGQGPRMGSVPQGPGDHPGGRVR